jgi:hypothetical protein
LAECAYAGREPTAAELDALELEARDRSAVSAAAREAVRIHASGERGQAHEHALRSAHALIGALPIEQQDPSYVTAPDPLAEIADPGELAARIPRF